MAQRRLCVLVRGRVNRGEPCWEVHEQDPRCDTTAKLNTWRILAFWSIHPTITPVGPPGPLHHGNRPPNHRDQHKPYGTDSTRGSSGLGWVLVDWGLILLGSQGSSGFKWVLLGTNWSTAVPHLQEHPGLWCKEDSTVRCNDMQTNFSYRDVGPTDEQGRTKQNLVILYLNIV